MTDLFKNAVESLRLGVQDYEMNTPERALSSVRNFYSGLLLFAKEVLVRAVPEADENSVIAERYKPVPDGGGNVKYIPATKRTIDLVEISRRFKDFGLQIDQKAIDDLSRIRNDIEHRYTKEPHDSMRQVIAKAFPVAVELFRLAGEDPLANLGDTWETMLNVREVYEQELGACRKTYEKINWHTGIFEGVACPECQSDLVAQDDPRNDDFQSAASHCRSCGAEISAEKLVEYAIELALGYDSYIAATDGDTDPVQDCPECGLHTYLLTEDEVGCVWCDFVLESECARCHAGLTPDNVDPDHHGLCSYCGNLWSKDD